MFIRRYAIGNGWKLVDGYKDVDDATETLNNFIKIGEKAILEQKELLSIGD